MKKKECVLGEDLKVKVLKNCILFKKVFVYFTCKCQHISYYVNFGKNIFDSLNNGYNGKGYTVK